MRGFPIVHEVEGDVRAPRSLGRHEWANAWVVAGYVSEATLAEQLGATIAELKRGGLMFLLR